MAKTMSVALRNELDANLGPGGATAALALINTVRDSSSLTTLDGTRDGPYGNSMSIALGGHGEYVAFCTGCATNTFTESAHTAMLNKMEHCLGGRGNAEELVACMLDGNVS